MLRMWQNMPAYKLDDKGTSFNCIYKNMDLLSLSLLDEEMQTIISFLIIHYYFKTAIFVSNYSILLISKLTSFSYPTLKLNSTPMLLYGENLITHKYLINSVV